jgi:tetratricopeptide (TPR) repeat protein
MPPPITFVVPGVRADDRTHGIRTAAPPPIGRPKDSVTVTAQRAQRGSGVRITAVPGEDIVIVQIAGGPELWLHPESARELLLSQQDPLMVRGGAEAPLAPGEIRVPARLQWRLEEVVPTRGTTRGFLGDVLVRAIHVITGIGQDKAADFVASKVVYLFDCQVDPGVYQLEPHTLESLKGRPQSRIAKSDQASLVLIHGTFSQTAGTFGKLWKEHPQLVGLLFEKFHNRIYALDHSTLGASPIANAITLAEAAPEDARLHLLTHSRGGLVAEVLARVCTNTGRPVADLFRGDASSTRELKTLAALVTRKRIAIDRIIRVACPARGTLLASKRLDAYVSVLKWALELAQIPIAPQLVDFLGEVARRRADPDMLPGLAAQIPDSPLIQWLHAANEPIKGDLRVVAGDLQGDSVVTWVKTLLSDAFYWTDNDLVVQTRSMYGGSPRDKDSTFILDQGGKVSHFNCFSSSQTASAVVSALTADTPDGFRVIGPLSWSGTSSTGVRAALPIRRAGEATELPALFILPGMLGSNLKDGADRIWLGSRLVNGFDRLAYDPKSTNVVPDGLIGSFYDELAAFFFNDYDVKPFAFDWRRPITAEAERLAVEVADALDARKTSKQPVRIIAHSIGGLVARTMQIVSCGTWDRMMDFDGGRILMLGTPNDGCWAPMQVLSGDDTFGNLLLSVGAPFCGAATRKLIANFPGFVQVQAGLLNGLGTEAMWRDLAKADLDAIRAHGQWHCLPLQLAQFEWGIPTQRVLDEAVRLRRALDRQRDTELASFAHNLVLVVGKAPFTPAGYELSDSGLVYLDASNQGDGRVMLESAVLPGVATWVVDADHGSLPRRKEAFEGYRDLLNKGNTDRFRPVTTTQIVRVRTAATAGAFVRSRPARRAIPETPPQRETEVLTPAAKAPVPRVLPAAAALRITIENGDLTYVSEPLLIGHYRASRLTGTEAVMDRAIGNSMTASLRRGLYPVAPGTHQVFVNVSSSSDNPWQLPRPEAVIVAGLGSEGELRGLDLVKTVQQAVIGWAQRLTERRSVPAGFTLAATLLGSGGSGITAGQAAQLISQGVRQANEQLAEDGARPPRWPRVDHLRIIELYLDRASEAWNAVQALAASAPALYVVGPIIEHGIGALRRPAEAGYRGTDYDFISASVARPEQEVEEIVYTVNSKRARSDVRPQPTQVPLIRNLVLTASSTANSDTQIGRTLFSLLVPVDLEPFMGSSTETVLELDEGTAAIPWEVLEPPNPANRDKPWSIRTKLLRKLRAAAPTITVMSTTAEDSILVIGDPGCDRSRYPRLMGARREAADVAACLTDAVSQSLDGQQPLTGARVTSVISGCNGDDFEPDAIAVINAVMQQPWRMIHIAGHGDPPVTIEKRMEPRGVVLSGDSFLGPREISALRVIPELVFVNCCHLATDDSSLFLKLTNYDRARFASGVAHALVKSGVRCVIAAGWAVDDEAASVFARKFYKTLLRGERFIDAVAAAREEARECGGNTWAAYQCYGDPDWRFRQQTGDAQRPILPPTGQEFASIASASSLILALEQIAVQSEYQREKPEAQAARLRYLEATFSRYWERGDVAEAFGNAWSKSGRFEEAIAWYERARAAEDGTASFASIEQLVNARIRIAWNRVADDKNRSPAAMARAQNKIKDAMTLLNTLLALAPTLERESIYGSGYKRLALLEAAAGREADEQNAIEQMRKHYTAAEKIARATPAGPPHALFYPAMNRIAAQLALADDGTRSEAMDANTIESVRRSMFSAPPDFWSVVGQTELDMYVSIAGGGLARDLERLIKDFRNHHESVNNPRMWGTVLDNATFVLLRYRRRAVRLEATAVDRLLAALGLLAARAAPPEPEGSNGSRRSARRPRRSGAKAIAKVKRPRGSPLTRRAKSVKSAR